MIMQLSAPTKLVFWISVVLAVLGILGFLVELPLISGIAFWLLLLGYLALFIGNVSKGLQQVE